MTRLQKAIAAWEASGRCAWHYPRKRLVSLNGHRAIPESEAIKHIENCLAKDEEQGK